MVTETDINRSYNYTMQVLQQYFSKDEIRQFPEHAIQNFENAVLEIANIWMPGMGVKDFINVAISMPPMDPAIISGAY